jgi:L-arabinose isomerase
MLRPVATPRISVLGLSLELYRRAVPGYLDRLEGSLRQFVGQLAGDIVVADQTLCTTPEHVARAVARAEAADSDALLIIPLSYTTSMTSVPVLLGTALPLVIWDTQLAHTIGRNYSFDDLLMNHVTQGTQDLTSTLLRHGRAFGLVTGHFRDVEVLAEVHEWLAAARAAAFARTLRVGLLGEPFEGMGDFTVEEQSLRQAWGPAIVRLSFDRLYELSRQAESEEVAALMAADRALFDVAPSLGEDAHHLSAVLELALRRLVAEEHLDALTMNFLAFIDDGRFGTLPFLGVNKLLSEGLGYAGEGDVATAAHMAQMRMLAGCANFTEIYTVDYRNCRLMMSHMQECNPALARRDRRIRLIPKKFWAPGVAPYVGMHFTLEPGPVTITCVVPKSDGGFGYVAREAVVVDMEPLPDFDIPHWMVQLDESPRLFLNRYCVAGGIHHLVAVPGHRAGDLAKLACLQGFPCQIL